MRKWWFCLMAILWGAGTGVIQGGVLDPYGAADDNPRTALGLDSHLNLAPADEGVWATGVIGEGFRHGTREAGFAAGAGFGMKVSSTRQHHDLALGSVYFGWMLGDVVFHDHWFRGNWELRAEAFGGEQFHPNRNYVAGIAPIIRYYFATGTRWIPFIDAGAGLSATDIRGPDLSTTFEYNLQGGVGVNYFWRKNSAITFQYRYLHLSNASLKSPDLGVNTSMFYGGMSWFF